MLTLKRASEVQGRPKAKILGSRIPWMEARVGVVEKRLQDVPRDRAADLVTHCVFNTES